MPAGPFERAPAALERERLRVALDATPLLGHPTGVGNFCAGALLGLGARHDLDVRAFAVSWRRRDAIGPLLAPGVSGEQRPMPARPLHALWSRWSFPPIEWFIGDTDVVHGTNFVVPPTRRAGRVVTVHDVTMLRFPELCDAATLRFPALIKRAVADGAWVHTPSAFVAAEVIDAFGVPAERVRAVHSGVPPLAEPGAAANGTAAGPGLPPGARRYVLAVGTAEPRKDLPGLVEAFDAMMTGRLDESQSIAAATLDLGLQIGVPDAFAFFAVQFFVIGTFAGRHDELFPLVEQVRRDNPGMLAFDVAYGIICAAVDRRDEARGILNEGMADGFAELPRDNIWMTSVIGYAVLAIELDDVDAAAQLLPVIEPYAGEVAFNGITSQGPIAAYVGKLASLLGRHDLAEDYLRSALATAEAFGWTYHRATTLFALAQGRHRRLGELDAEGRLWLSEAAKLCQAYGFRSWKDPIDALAVEGGLLTRW